MNIINNLDKVQICDKNVKSLKIDNNDKKQLILNAEKCLKNASEKCLSQLGKEFIPNPKINFIEQPQINYSLFTSTDFDAFIYLIYLKLLLIYYNNSKNPIYGFIFLIVG